MSAILAILVGYLGMLALLAMTRILFNTNEREVAVLILALMSIWGTFPAGLLLFGWQVLGVTFTVAKFRDPKTGLYPGEDVGEGAAAVVVAQAEA